MRRQRRVEWEETGGLGFTSHDRLSRRIIDSSVSVDGLRTPIRGRKPSKKSRCLWGKNVYRVYRIEFVDLSAEVKDSRAEGTESRIVKNTPNIYVSTRIDT